MHYRALFAAVAVAALSACKASQGLMPDDCTPGQCRLKVKVGENCALEVIPEHLYVPPGDAVSILWMIDPPSTDAHFDTNGISFKPGQNPDQQFDEKRPESGGKAFHWRDKNTLAGRFKYDVNVRDGQGRLCHLDPFIYNR